MLEYPSSRILLFGMAFDVCVFRKPFRTLISPLSRAAIFRHLLGHAHSGGVTRFADADLVVVKL
jgi:hypothetical protein